MANLNLPDDLVAFLRAGKQLDYDPGACEAGAVTLLPLHQLKVELFPMYCPSTEVAEQDPHRDENGCYLVEGVSLVAGCTGGYDAPGLLLWLPRDERYATWDSSHDYLAVFAPGATWSHIVAAPAQHINAQWTGMFDDSAPVSCLVPWPRHPYNVEQVHHPLPDLAEWYEAKWTRRGLVQDGKQLRFAETIHMRVERHGDRYEMTAEVKQMDERMEWQPTAAPLARSVTARDWQQVLPSLEAGFWRQPPMPAEAQTFETAAMWSFSGYRAVRYHTVFRSYDDSGEVDAVHELGRHLAALAGIPRFEAPK